ncbi:MAG: hypothetical protein ACLFQK_01380 [Fibrobacterota bacterium]
MKKKIKIFSLILLITFISGCVHQRQFLKKGFNPAAAGLVLVFPFENLTPDPNAGKIATSVFTAELRSKGTILLREYKKSEKDEISDAGIFDEIDYLSEAKKSGAESYLTGTVTEYKYKKGLGEEPVVGLTSRLTNTATSEVLWESSISVTPGLGSLKEQSLSRFLQIAAEKMTKAIK